MFNIEISPGTVDWKRVTVAQCQAREGLYAQAMAGFVKWLAPKYEEIRDGLASLTADLRVAATRDQQHRRTPQIVADLAVGLRYFLAFAFDAEAVTVQEAQALWEQCWTALGEAASAQAQYQVGSEPAQRFLELLQAAITGGEAHIASESGSTPPNPEVWGWTKVTAEDWRPGGKRVGWVDQEDLYLQPDVAYKAAQVMGREGEGLVVSSTALWKRLKDRGLLASLEQGRGSLKVRRVLQGQRRTVIHLHSTRLMSAEPAQVAQSAQDDDLNGPASMAVPPLWASSWAGFESPPAKLAHETCPSEADGTHDGSDDGQDGQDGQVLLTTIEDVGDV